MKPNPVNLNIHNSHLMKTAIIDCGTNTFHLLLAEHDRKGNYRVLVNDKLSVKLVEGRILQNEIAPEPFHRGLKAFEELAAKARKYKPDFLEAYATSAIRSASNGSDFVNKVFGSTGISIKVIDGDEEALLIYKGVKLAMGNIEQPILIMDIGGGSTEFILAKNNSILWKQSFKLGVARLLQTFNPSDPFTAKDIRALQAFFEKELGPLKEQIKRVAPSMLVGCSGSFESLASMIGMRFYEREPHKTLRVFPFKEREYLEIHNLLLHSDEAARYQISGLVPMRVDTIVYASIFIHFVKHHFNIPEMALSYFALKEGAFSDILKKESGEIIK